MEAKLIEEIDKILAKCLGQIGEKLKAGVMKRLAGDNKIAGAKPNLIGDINYNVKEEGLCWVLEIGTTKNYLRYIEEGRPPGKMPPVGAIVNWIHQKIRRNSQFIKVPSNVDSENYIQGVGWAMAINMKKKGIRPFPVLEFVLNQNRSFIEREINNAMAAIGKK